jgi:hypothetical protein
MRAIGKISAEDYAVWAGEMLVQNHDSTSLRILAGLNRRDSIFEAQDYFLRAMKELNLEEPEPDAAVREYARETAKQIIDGQIEPQQGVRALYQICVATEYPEELMIWYELDDALDCLIASGYPYTYETATLENFDSIVKEEAKKFVANIEEAQKEA